MKKIYNILGLIFALLIIGCTADDDIGGVKTQNLTPIDFSFVRNNITRGYSVGSDAATKLHNHFNVYGEKWVGTTSTKVFDHYEVKYDANTYTDIPTHWKYDGIQGNQEIKYWDYSAEKYTFDAYSVNGGTFAQSPVNGYYEFNGTSDNFAELYISEHKVVEKSSYNQTVTLVFKTLASKVRLGFYETIPGYHITSMTFHIGANAVSTDGDNVVVKGGFNNTTSGSVQASFNYNNVANDGDMPVVTYGNQKVTEHNFGKLTLKDENNNPYLATTQAGANYASGGYVTMFPSNDKEEPMVLKIDFVLESNDGSDETIKVTNANVTVGTEYLKWESNKAYTYIFKITENTNGTTGEVNEDGTPKDTEGLFPIIFDAKVEEMEEVNKEVEIKN